MTHDEGQPREHQSHLVRSDASRRDFLKRAALVAGAGVAGVAMASGAGEVPPIKAKPRGTRPTPPRAGEPIRIGVIGTGGMGRGHCGSLAAMGASGGNVEVAAVCDVNDLHMQEAVEYIATSGQSLTPDTTRDHTELLARNDIHGVVIASPEHQHGRHAVDAIAAGKDVYCEKPVTLTLPEAMAIRKTLEANPGVMFVVGTQKMMLPKYREAQRVIESGGIGTPTFSQTSYCRNSPDGEWNYYEIDPRWEPGVNLDWERWLGHLGPREWDPKVYIRWRRYRDFSTGIIGDLLVHEVTPMLMALKSQGWPTRVVASGSHLVDTEMENHDQVNLQVEFETGHILTVAGSTSNEVGLENLIRGHEGNIYLNSRHCVVRPTRPYVDLVDRQRIECPDIGNDQQQLREAWLSSIRTREQPDSDIDLATRMMVIVDLAARSIWDGRAYRFDPETMTTRAI